MSKLDLQQKLELSQQELKNKIERVAELDAERDTLQQQVNALAAAYERMDWVLTQEGMQLPDPTPEEVVAIKRQWMAEGIQSYVNKVLVENKRIAESIGKESVAAVFDHLKKEAEEFAAQLRQPEEKGHD